MTVMFTPARTLTLFQLVVTASTVHHDSPCYWLFWRQCYWFTDVLLQEPTRPSTAIADDRNPGEDNYDEVQVPKGLDEEVFCVRNRRWIDWRS
jgi:hypothetical protein